MPTCAFRRSSRSLSRCCGPPAGRTGRTRRACSCRSSRRGRRAGRGTRTPRTAAARRSRRPGCAVDTPLTPTTRSSMSSSREDHPAVAELVVARLDGRAGVAARAAHDLLHVLHDLLEVGGGQRLEDDRRLARDFRSQLRLERDVGGRHREQPVRRAGCLSLRLPRRMSRKPMLGRRSCPAAAPPGAAGAAIRFSIGGCVANSVAERPCRRPPGR